MTATSFRLTPFFKELIEKRWSDFATMEQDALSHTSAQGVVFAIVRACAKGKLPAIKESLNRIDGKLQEQIEVEYPKFYMLFPYATKALPGSQPSADLQAPDTDDLPEDPVTGSLRDTLVRMSNEPRALVDAILGAAREIDKIAEYKGDFPEANDPLVKSVITAGLLKLAHNGSLGAIFEVFDQIDGKLADKIKVLGEDVYITSYAEVAPAGAQKNQDGVYFIEADNTTNQWAVALGRKDDGRVLK